MTGPPDPAVDIVLGAAGLLLLAVGVGPQVWRLRRDRRPAAHRVPLAGRLDALRRTVWRGVGGTYLLGASVAVPLLGGAGPAALVVMAASTTGVAGAYGAVAYAARRRRRWDEAVATEVESLADEVRPKRQPE